MVPSVPFPRVLQMSPEKEKEEIMKNVFITLAAVAVLFAGARVASAEVLVNNDGGVCIDAEGSLQAGSRLIAYTCHGGQNQQVKLERGRLIVGGRFCATARSRNKGSELYLAGCDFSANGDALQNFAKWSGGKVGHNSGYVLAASGNYWGTNRPLCLWDDQGRADQKWRFGNVIQYSQGMTFNGATQAVYVPGKQGMIRVSSGQMVAAGGGNMVAAGGGNIVAAGGLN
jgi:hypothetical protein